MREAGEARAVGMEREADLERVKELTLRWAVGWPKGEGKRFGCFQVVLRLSQHSLKARVQEEEERVSVGPVELEAPVEKHMEHWARGWRQGCAGGCRLLPLFTVSQPQDLGEDVALGR